MSGVVKAVVGVVGLAALFIPGVGTAIGASLAFSGLGSGVATAIGYGIAAAGISFGVSTIARIAGLGPKSPKISSASTDRLNASINPRAYRSSVVGITAMNTDVAYQEFTGANQEYYNQVIVCASHGVESIDQIWLDDELAWSSGGGVVSKYSGYLTVTTRMEGTAANALTITGSSSWTAANSRLVGCAYVWLRYKLTGNSKKTESPFAGGLTTRITIKGKGAKLYDPRQDTTVGGSGTQRADDQSTWAWSSDDVGRNPPLQLLWFLLGYRITNPTTSAQKLAVGAGIPPARIDIDSFITAANMCDESVALAIGGTEPRYRADGVWNEGDDPKTVQDALLAAMNGVLRDAGGKLRLEILHNDLSTPVTSLSHADVVGEFQWVQTPAIDQTFNVVRGQYVDATNEGLYQLVDYPDVSIDTPDGIDRDQQFSCPMVQSPSQAQRLAKTFLQRAQYPGTFSAEFLASAWNCEVGSPVTLTFPALAFDNKLFRVIEHSIQFNGLCRMVLREENAAIYVWDAEEAGAVTAAAPNTYNPLNNPVLSAINNDVGSVIAGPAAITINADATGTITTYLPRNQAYTLFNGGVDVTTSAAWSVSVVSGTISASVGSSTGILSLDKSGGVLTNSLVRITAEYGGFAQVFDVTVTKVIGSAMASGGPSGAVGVAITTTTMVAASDEITVTVGSGGNVLLSASYDFVADATSGNYSVYAQWYHWNGSAYVALDSEVESDVPFNGTAENIGSGSISYSHTGLTPAASEKYRLYMRNKLNATRRDVWGSVSGAGS